MARKVKGYYPRGGKWQVDTSHKGIRIRELLATEEMAKKAITKAQTLIDEDRYLEKKRKPTVTLAQFAEVYIRWCENEGQKAVCDKAKRLRRIVQDLGQERLLADIESQALESWKELRLSAPSARGRKIEAATVNRELANVKHMLTKAVDWGILTENPARRVKLLKIKNHSLRYLAAEELEKLVNGASAYLRPILVLAVNTGLRRGEILKLKWSDVNFQTGLIELLDQKNGDRSYVPLNQAAREALRKVPRRVDSPYIFSKGDGQPPVDFKRGFYIALRKSGIDHCSFHSLRHTFASHLAMNGVDVLTIKELMRHKTLTMTLRYAHLSSQHTRRAVDELSFSHPGTVQKAQENG